MTINWYGEGCFKIVENGVTITTEPVDSTVGLVAPRYKDDIIIKTLSPAPIAGKDRWAMLDESGAHIISGPGEYEVKGVVITGWQLMKDSAPEFIKTVYRIQTEDLTIGLLGHLTEFNEPEILEELGEVDVLIIPGGGKPFIDQEAAAKLIRQIEPKLVIPSFFKTPGLKRKAEDVSEFLKQVGHKAEPEEKLSVKKKELGEKLKVVVLKV